MSSSMRKVQAMTVSSGHARMFPRGNNLQSNPPSPGALLRPIRDAVQEVSSAVGAIADSTRQPSSRWSGQSSHSGGGAAEGGF